MKFDFVRNKEKEKIRCLTFADLCSGDLFIDKNNTPHICIYSICDLEGDEINAINLNNGSAKFFSHNEQVQKYTDPIVLNSNAFIDRVVIS